jgi:hypothetical protein
MVAGVGEEEEAIHLMTDRKQQTNEFQTQMVERLV